MSRVVMGMSTHHVLPDRLHRVADIHFVPRSSADTAAVVCTCSWSGTVGAWEDHRGRGKFGKTAVSRASTELEAFETA